MAPPAANAHRAHSLRAHGSSLRSSLFYAAEASNCKTQLIMLHHSFQNTPHQPLPAMLRGDPCYTAPGPATPMDFSCTGGSHALHLTATLDNITDAVSVELFRADFALALPNLHFVLPAEAGRLSASVPYLEDDTVYRLALRAHRTGCAEDGGNGSWS